jgi:hypothetical protein
MAFLAFMLADAIPQTKQQEYWEPTEDYRIEIDRANPEIRNLIARWEEIGDELKTTTNSFAGTYEHQAYRGWFLRWSPDEGFVYVYHSEGLSIIDFSYGKVRSTSEAIILEPEREMKETFDSKRLSTPKKWIPIGSSFGAYLVPEERIKEFGNYAGGFGEYNDFNGPCCDFSPFFFMPTDSTPQASHPSILVVPPTYQQFIKEPIKARIEVVGVKAFVKNYGLEGKLYSQLFPKASLTPVVLNAGRRQGVKKNQLFRLIGEPRNQYLRILIVRNKRASGVVVRDVDDDGKETYFDGLAGMKEPEKKLFHPIRVGTKVTTSPILDF